MPNLIIPETIFFSTLKSILKLIRDDWNNNTDKNKTILYKSFNDVGSLERFNFYTQLQKIICTEKDDPRTFDFSLGFNMSRMTTPHCHITLPSENSGQNGLGLDQNEDEDIFDEETQTYKKTFKRRFDSSYSFTITSDNMNEVIAIYHWLRSILIQLINHLELSDLEHIRISGGDINLNSQLVPTAIFMRNINISFSYDLKVEELFSHDYINKLIFVQDPTVIPDSEVDASDSITYT